MNLLRQLENLFQGEVDSEMKLVTAAQHGSREAFDSLMRSHESQLRGFICRRVGMGAVDDVLQETWLASWLALPKFSRRSRFKAWLFGIAFHKSNDYHRKRGRTAQELPLHEIETAAASQDWIADAELRQTVRTLLAELPLEQREVLEMYYYAELTLAEVAQELGRSLNTVKSQFYRAHTKIAHQFDTPEALKGGRLLVSESRERP